MKEIGLLGGIISVYVPIYRPADRDGRR